MLSYYNAIGVAKQAKFERVDLMAKATKSNGFSHATIYFGEDGHIYCDEITKDDVQTFDLTEVFKSWKGVENVAITIKQESVIAPHVGG